VIIVGIYITRDKIYGLKSKLNNFDENAFNLNSGNGVVEALIDGAVAKVTTNIEAMPGDAIRKTVKDLMEDRLAPDFISIACYGPFSSLDPNNNDELTTYGKIDADAHFAPFRGFNLEEEFETAFRRNGVEKRIAQNVTIQTDVAAAGLAEWAMRQNEIAICHGEEISINREHLVYLSFSGGIGGAVIDRSGKIVNGFLHPEMGQIPIELHPRDQRSGMKSVCPHHINCLEGYASEEAFLNRFANLPSCIDEIIDDTNGEAWEIHAFYVAQLCAAVTLLFSPTVIVLSGDVFAEPDFFKLVRRLSLKRLSGETDKIFAWYPLLERDDGFFQTTKLREPGIPGAACIPVMQNSMGELLSTGANNG